MSLDIKELTSKMLAAFKGEFGEKWPEVEAYATTETNKIAQNFIMIETLRATGEISEEQAKLHHEIQKNATRSVLLTVEGLGLLAVEQAINSAMDVLKDTVNSALDFVLI